MGYVLAVLQIAVLVTAVYAFVHAAMQRPDAYTAAGKLTKSILVEDETNPFRNTGSNGSPCMP